VPQPHFQRLSTTPRIKDEHAVQLRTYLDDGQLAVGLLLNFGGDDPEFRRVENHNSPAFLQ